MLERFWQKVDLALELLDIDDDLMTHRLQDCLHELQAVPVTRRDSDYFHLCGYICYSKRPQQLHEAERYFKAALELDPFNAYARLYLGHCYYDSGAYQLAMECFLLVEKGDLPEFLQMKVDEMVVCCNLRMSLFTCGLVDEVREFLRTYAPQNYCEDYPFELQKTLGLLGENLEDQESKALQKHEFGQS
jgi:tetratricopeptide (TPR) repeat protein